MLRSQIPTLALAATLITCGGTQPAEVLIQPDSVMLEYGSGEMVIHGTLTKGDGRAPDRVWVWAYFVNPRVPIDSSSWSDMPIELVAPFADGLDSVRIVARGPFHWSTNTDVPKDGFYTRVFASAVSPEAVQMPPSDRDYELQGMVEVQSR